MTRRRRSRPQSSGKAWERWLDDIHAVYSARGWAEIVRTNAPYTLLRRLDNGTFIGRLDGKGPPDNSGTLRGGRSVVFENKRTEAERWPFGDLKRHQADHLTRHMRMGALTFIALRSPHGDWVLHWDKLEPLWRGWSEARARLRKGQRVAPGTASLTVQQLGTVGVRFDANGWLHAVTCYNKDEASVMREHAEASTQAVRSPDARPE